MQEMLFCIEVGKLISKYIYIWSVKVKHIRGTLLLQILTQMQINLVKVSAGLEEKLFSYEHLYPFLIYKY